MDRSGLVQVGVIPGEGVHQFVSGYCDMRAPTAGDNIPPVTVAAPMSLSDQRAESGVTDGVRTPLRGTPEAVGSVCLFIYWSFRARRLQTSFCAHAAGSVGWGGDVLTLGPG